MNERTQRFLTLVLGMIVLAIVPYLVGLSFFYWMSKESDMFLTWMTGLGLSIGTYVLIAVIVKLYLWVWRGESFF